MSQETYRDVFGRDAVQVIARREHLLLLVVEQYALLSIGWMQSERVCGTTLLLRIKDGKIWVEEDATDAPIAEDLAHAGIALDDIVLGFQPPQMRAYTTFAAA